MGESLRLIALSLGFLAVFAALGSGPVVALGRGLRARAVLAPVVGLSLAASLLTTAGLVVSTQTSAFLVLLPACLGSAIWAAWASDRVRVDLGELAAPAAIGAVGLAVALLPGLLRETVGPISLAHFDVWAYLPASHWLQQHSIADALPAFATRYDLTLGTGYGLTECGCRLGATEAQAGVASLFGTGADDTSLPLLAALFALMPAGVWFAARNLGAGRPASAFGAAFGLSPALLLFVADSTLGTLAGLVLAAPLAVLAFRRPDDQRAGPMILAGLLLGGLIPIYPEFLLSFLAVCAVGAVASVVARKRRGRLSSDWAWETAKPLAGVALVAAITSPAGLQRAVDYFGTVSSIQIELPRYLTVQGFGSWAFGVLHIYELRRFSDLSGLETAAAIALPLLLAALVVLGTLRAGGRGAFVVAGPVVASALLAVWVYHRYGDHHCQYCMFKALTFALPFLAVGLALGMQSLLARSDGRTAVRAAAALLAIVAMAAIARADGQMVRALDVSAAEMSSDERGLGAAIDRQGSPAPLLLEGMDATSVPLWDTPQAYYLARQAPGSRISFDARGVAATALFRVLPADRYYSPDYRLVVTTFPGLRSGRRLLSRHGPYALMRRAPIDVLITRPGWAFDPAQGAAAVPWLQGPLQLWIASPAAGPAGLRYALGGPRAAGTMLRFAGPAVLGAGARCVALRLRPGLNRVDVSPRLAGSHAPTYPAAPSTGVAFPSAALDESIRSSESDPIPPPPRIASLTELRVRPGGCR